MFFTTLFYFPHLQESTKHFAKNAQDKQRREREGEKEVEEKHSRRRKPTIGSRLNVFMLLHRQTCGKNFSLLKRTAVHALQVLWNEIRFYFMITTNASLW
jgi:hypothetical protein